MPFLSVIVPVYMVEPWLDACVESVLAQGVDELEMILVDDGSPDACPELCDAWAARDDRVRVLHKENGGLSDARNAGISVATGKYLLFLDSDDTLLPNSLSLAVKKLRALTPDVLIGHYCQTDLITGQLLIKKDCTIIPSCIDGQDRNTVLGELKRARMSHCAWRYFVRHDFLLQNSLFFVKGLLSEDAHWTPRLLCAAHSFALLPSSFYNYYVRPGSIMTTQNFKRITDLLWIAEQNSLLALEKTGNECSFVLNTVCVTTNLALQGWPRFSSEEKMVVQSWFGQHGALVRQAAKVRFPLRLLVALLGPFYGSLLAARLVRVKVRLTGGGD